MQTTKTKVPRRRGGQNAVAPLSAPESVSDASDIVRDYNGALQAKIGPTAGNVAAAMRALGQGYTREQLARVFAAVRDKSTETAAWCAENNHAFEYLIRPMFRHYLTGEQTQGPLDKILNELGTPTPKRAPEPERPLQTGQDQEKQRALWEAGRDLFKRETGL